MCATEPLVHVVYHYVVQCQRQGRQCSARTSGGIVIRVLIASYLGDRGCIERLIILDQPIWFRRHLGGLDTAEKEASPLPINRKPPHSRGSALKGEPSLSLTRPAIRSCLVASMAILSATLACLGEDSASIAWEMCLFRVLVATPHASHTAPLTLSPPPATNTSPSPRPP